MTRLLYVGWIASGLLLFVAALLFVLANPQTVSLTVFAPGAPISMGLGILVLLVFILGAGIGLVAGFGVRHLLQMVQRRPR